jgi:large repetitive protein
VSVGCRDSGTLPSRHHPPETEITRAAPNKTDKTKVKFKFTSDDLDATFECKLDNLGFGECKSPLKLKRLGFGKHKFKVRAIDAAGNVDSTPAKDKFKVVG